MVDIPMQDRKRAAVVAETARPVGRPTVKLQSKLAVRKLDINGNVYDLCPNCGKDTRPGRERGPSPNDDQYLRCEFCGKIYVFTPARVRPLP